MNKIIRKDEVINLTESSSFTVLDDISVTLYVFGNFNVEFILGRNSKVLVYHYNVDCDTNVRIYLREEMANIDYYYSIISKNDHNIKLEVFHEADNTVSNIYNNVVNVFDKKFYLDVVGKVLSGVNGYICNQSSQVINMSDGCSVICPNLLIDSFGGSSSHSTYIGKFDDDKLFYLMSRGIKLESSIHILLMAFLVDIGADRNLINDFLLELDKI